MTKAEELSNPQSCMSRAADHEMTFVLLARDICAPEIIRRWCESRVDRGKNTWDDDQIKEAMHCASYMEQQQRDGIGLSVLASHAPIDNTAREVTDEYMANFGGAPNESWSETTIDNEGVAWVLRAEAEVRIAEALLHPETWNNDY